MKLKIEKTDEFVKLSDKLQGNVTKCYQAYIGVTNVDMLVKDTFLDIYEQKDCSNMVAKVPVAIANNTMQLFIFKVSF